MDLTTYRDKFEQLETPFYYYDTQLFKQTLEEANRCAAEIPSSMIHFAIKANANSTLLQYVKNAGMGADCVSGGEIQRCIDAGIPANKIMFAGVGKTDKEIRLGIENDILCFNVESLPEIDIINDLAKEMHKKARVAVRINPNIDAHTHKFITTGLEENKFGISMEDMIAAIHHVQQADCLEYYGLHFHIGSQILNFNSFKMLSCCINKLQKKLDAAGIKTMSINVGGGLGIDYDHPQEHDIPDFKAYFDTFKRHLELRPGQTLHFELGRALCAQCGALITRTVLVKKSGTKQFAIVDAGFTDLIRPALYQAHHKIINLSGTGKRQKYDVVGPICESSDVFDKDIHLSTVQRGDLIAILSAGAYGFVMASQYNCRHLPQEYCTENLK